MSVSAGEQQVSNKLQLFFCYGSSKEEMTDPRSYWNSLNSAVNDAYLSLSQLIRDRYTDLYVSPLEALTQLQSTPEGRARIEDVQEQYSILTSVLAEMQPADGQRRTLEVMNAVDVKRWKLLGPQLYTLCSLPPSTNQEDIDYQDELMKARVKDLRQLYPDTGCTRQSLVTACALKSVDLMSAKTLPQMKRDSKEFMGKDSTCGKVFHNPFFASSPSGDRSLHVRLNADTLRLQVDPANNRYSQAMLVGMQPPQGCTVQIIEGGSELLQALMQAQGDNFTEIRVDMLVSSLEAPVMFNNRMHTLIAARSDDGQLVGLMLLRKSYPLEMRDDEGGYIVIEQVDIPDLVSPCGASKRQVFVLMLSALLRVLDQPRLKGKYVMLKHTIQKEPAKVRMLSDLGFTCFPLEIISEGEPCDFFLDIGMTQGVDFFRLLKHTLVLGNPLQLWLLLSEVASSLKRSVVAWSDPSLIRNIVQLISVLPGWGVTEAMLRVLAFFLVTGPYFDIASIFPLHQQRRRQREEEDTEEQQLRRVRQRVENQLSG